MTRSNYYASKGRIRMTFNQVITLTLVILCSAVTPRAYAGEPIASFTRLSKEADIIFSPPQELEEIAVVPMPFFPFEKAYRHKRFALEIRYAIRPLSRISIDFTDPHGLTPAPGTVFPLVLTALIGQFAQHADAPKHEYITEQAKSLFNADWAAASQFKASPKAKSQYKFALLLAIHKDKRGDAYTMFLFNDPKAVKKTINKVVNTMRFAP
jgi:hypothetical protein